MEAEEEENEEEELEAEDDVEEEGELGGDRYGGLSMDSAALSFDLDRWLVWLPPSVVLECDVGEPEEGAEDL